MRTKAIAACRQDLADSLSVPKIVRRGEPDSRRLGSMRVRFAVLELLAAIVVIVHNSNGVSTTNQPFSSSQARPLMCCLSILVSKLSPRKARPRAPVPQGVVTVPSRCKECLLPEIHGNRISNPTFKESPELPQADAGILLNTIGVALSVKIMTRELGWK